MHSREQGLLRDSKRRTLFFDEKGLQFLNSLPASLFDAVNRRALQLCSSSIFVLPDYHQYVCAVLNPQSNWLH